MRNKKLASLILVSTILLSGCGQTIKASDSDYIPQTFYKDENTMRVADEKSWLLDSYEQSNNDSASYNQNVTDEGLSNRPEDTEFGEIELIGEDATTPWEIVNNTDIVYKGTTFHDLYTCVNSIELPYTKETFINFILKTYETSELDVWTECRNDNEETIDDIIKVSEVLEGTDGYIDLVNKYGQEVNWELKLFCTGGKNPGYIYGCSQYIMRRGSTDVAEVDMSTFVDMTEAEEMLETQTIQATETTAETQETVETGEGNIE